MSACNKLRSVCAANPTGPASNDAGEQLAVNHLASGAGGREGRRKGKHGTLCRKRASLEMAEEKCRVRARKGIRDQGHGTWDMIGVVSGAFSGLDEQR
jgi:hypothetical protein